jgi:hypothetical protein
MSTAYQVIQIQFTLLNSWISHMQELTLLKYVETMLKMDNFSLFEVCISKLIHLLVVHIIFFIV